MIWLKSVILLHSFWSADSLAITEQPYPGTMEECVKYLDYSAAHPDATGKNNPAVIERPSPNILIQTSEMGWNTLIIVRSCTEVK